MLIMDKLSLFNPSIVYNAPPMANNTTQMLDILHLASHALPPYIVVLCTIVSIFSCLATFGNVLVIYAIVSTISLKTVTNYIISSLATADLIVGIVVMPLKIYQDLQPGVWMLGLVVCDVWHSMDVLGKFLA